MQIDSIGTCDSIEKQKYKEMTVLKNDDKTIMLPTVNFKIRVIEFSFKVKVWVKTITV